VKAIIFILAVHSIAHTIATQRITKPVRDYLSPKLGEYWSHLIKCPYCIAYHVAWVLLLIYSSITPKPFYSISGNGIFDFFVCWMALAGSANYLTWFLCDKIKQTNGVKK